MLSASGKPHYSRERYDGQDFNMVAVMTGPSGFSSQHKKPDCEWYPDIRPSLDITGRRSGKLVAAYPVYAMRRHGSSGRVFFWLMTCDCGQETITCNTASVKSCGCARKEAIKKMVATKKADSERRKAAGEIDLRGRRILPLPGGKFDRLKICNNLPFQCVHYDDCQDERLEGKIVSSRYQQDRSCYTPGRQERKYIEGIAP